MKYKKSLIIRVLLLAVLLACLILPVQSIYAASWLGSWAYRIPLTIDTTNVDADLADYPVYINLSTSSGITDADVSAVFDELGADSLKIAVTTDDGTTECAVEIVSWDNVGETAELWACIPAVDDTADTIIYLYYDDSQSDNSTYVGVVGSTAGKLVWNTDGNYKAVWHMNDATTSTILDSTGVNDGAKDSANNPNQVAGGIGKAQDFNGTTNKITVADSASLSALSALTVETYFNSDAVNSSALISKRGAYDGNNEEWVLQFVSGVLAFVDLSTGTDNYLVSIGTTNLSDTTYHYGAASWDGTNAISHQKIYADGLPDELTTNSKSGTGAVPFDGNYAVEIGRQMVNNTTCFNGKQSEVRISNIARSAAYIKANQYCFTDALVTFGSAEIYTIYKPINLVATINGNNINLSWENVSAQVKIYRGTINYPTSITDGTLVYSGALETYSDTGLDLDKTQYYYSAWGWDGTVTYSPDYATTSNGGVAMVLIALLIGLIGLTWLTVSKIPVCGILTFGIAIFTWYYLQNNPLPNISATSSVATIIMLVLWGWGIMVGLYGAGKVFSKNDSRPFIEKAFHRDDTQRVYSVKDNGRKLNPQSSSMEERELAHRMEVRARLNKYRR